MCGIAGIIDLAGQQRLITRSLAVMLGELEHRGPDGEGRFAEGPVAMGMRRLSIIDLRRGGQPFYGLGGRIVAFQNGEIYNYRSLRQELRRLGYSFRSDSDTEVVAHGYAAWGMDGMLDKLDGMFAIAILDRRSGELHLARDRFGEKPLFYAWAEGKFAYCSSMAVVAALPWVDNDVRPRSLERYLALHYIPGRQTLLAGVHRVLPGERLSVRVTDPVPRKSRYYRFPPPSADAEQPSETKVAELLEQAVTSRLAADVPVGVFLSGGLDSSLVAAIAARSQPGLPTFSMGFASAEHDESEHARTVAAAIGSRHHRYRFDEAAFLSLLPQTASALDEPNGDQALLPLYWLCREARKDVKVVLSGEGADEAFAGYFYYRRFLASNGERPVQSLIHDDRAISPSGFPLLTDVYTRQRLLIAGDDACDPWERRILRDIEGLPPLARATAADLLTWLPDDLLVKFDRMSMAHGLEGRAPYLFKELVEYGIRLPDPSRMTADRVKVLLRQAAKRYLPESIVERPKQGFVLPMRDWLRQWFNEHGPARPYFIRRSVPGLDMDAVAAIAERTLADGIRNDRLLFALVMLAEWQHAFERKRGSLRKRLGLPL
ncbi:asparagine synthase (glutamine-hydrolyzing) [Cohnella panacarvi]|uniref:asparagine synthase (glutamine-hydrolyzing) n=1 Tax=Cohnella panacarvi TaxID=400776 RepID=UPI00047DE9E9|nr:asparagine synthase (glutamine-hydrolyzing) [Cohnella panacarvi]